MNGTTVSNTIRHDRVLLMAICLATCSAGCGREPVAVVDHEHRVYVDLPTQKPWMLPVQDHVPAKHPETGKNTLMPGLYCPQCGRWYASPPVDVVQRTGSASRCPKGGHAMSPHGPAPQG